MGAPVIDAGTIGGLGAALALILIAYLLSVFLLHPSTSRNLRILYIWHVFDALIHLLFEGSFLYQCFFSHRPGVSSNNFLNQPLRIYGANSGPTTSPTAMLWREYAKADARWGYSDLTVVSLELLTVLLGGPAALAVAEGIRRRSGWWMYFVMIILATAELYGGFMTFAPEWLSGNRGLDTSNWMYLWLYLVFFNVLWVFLPVFALYEAFASVGKLVEKGHEAVRHKKKH